MKPRPHIMQACAIVSDAKRCPAAHVKQLMGLDVNNTFRHLTRAVGLGLLTVDRSTTPHEYRAVPGWRQLAAFKRPAYKPVKIKFQDSAIVRQALQVQAGWIFGMGAIK